MGARCRTLSRTDDAEVREMATLTREGDTLWLNLSAAEKVEGLHGDLSAPVDQVQSAEVLDDAIHAVHGLKLPGSRLPGVFAMGTFVAGEGRTFAIVHHHPRSGVAITFASGPYVRWIVSTEDPRALLAALGL